MNISINRVYLHSHSAYDMKRIKEFRESLNMSQEYFAHEVGVTYATVNRWERGQTTPNKFSQRALIAYEKKIKNRQKAELRKATH